MWAPHSLQDCEKLESVQRRMARFIFNNYSRTSSVTRMLEDLHWATLDLFYLFIINFSKEGYHKRQDCLYKVVPNTEYTIHTHRTYIHLHTKQIQKVHVHNK